MINIGHTDSNSVINDNSLSNNVYNGGGFTFLSTGLWTNSETSFENIVTNTKDVSESCMSLSYNY